MNKLINQTNENMSNKPHALKVQGDDWEQIEDLAWKVSAKLKRVIRPSTICHMVIRVGLQEITTEEILEMLEKH